MYKQVLNNISFPKMEEEILQFWKNHQIFNKSMEKRKKSENFVFYDGPPGTNGYPHLGNIYQSVLKDLWPRYKSMKGYKVVRKAGWDTHGLPIELRSEKDLGLNSKKDIQDYGVEEFIKYCRDSVFRYKKEWVNSITRIGRFLDFENEYSTLTNDFIQSDWWVLKQAWKKKLLYKGHKVLAYCPRLGTSLSNNEVAQGYRELTDLALFVKFPLKNDKNTFFLAWTTTSWTLIGNVALALGGNIDYSKIEFNNENYIIANSRLYFLKSKGFFSNYKLISSFKGSDLKGIEYEALWPFFLNEKSKQHYVIIDDYVSVNEGTGIVHISSYGEDDYRLIRKNNLPIIQHVDLDGKFIVNCDNYFGRMFDEKGLDLEILKDLIHKNKFFAKEKIKHNYPCNYRTGNRLLYYPKSNWFLKTTAYKDKIIAANKKINWYPSHIRDGRFGKWLENNVDWAISRERFWGSPLPIWICLFCNHEICVESIKELSQLSKKEIDENFDLHIPFIDKITIPCPKCSKTMKREPDVLDCWFNSGVMPWGQFAYPNKKGSKELFKSLYPADFICEGQDQTRGWFYALIALSTMITNQSSYKNVICTELIVDENGRKMSKSLGNIIDPMEIILKYGADSIRWFFLTTNYSNSIRFSESFLKDVIKQIILPLWNCYSFFVTYANIDKYHHSKSSTSLIDNISTKLINPLDIWIISETQKLIKNVSFSLDSYDSMQATQIIYDFIDNLSNWYIRRSRRRFWKAENDDDKYQAYNTLYYVLINLIKVSAPFIPFITEKIYQNLVLFQNNKKVSNSIHLCDYPIENNSLRRKAIEYEMRLIRNVVSLGRSLRNNYQIKIRQPLSELIIICHKDKDKDKKIIQKMINLIKDELNIKKINFTDNDSNFVNLIVKPNLKLLGPRFGKELKNIISLINNLNENDIKKLENKISISLKNKDKFFSLVLEDVIIQRKEKKGLLIQISENITVVLNSKITSELKEEGFAREFINKVQNMRKELNLEVMDNIFVHYYGSIQIKNSIEKWNIFISNEILALKINYQKNINSSAKTWDLNNEKVLILVTKAS